MIGNKSIFSNQTTSKISGSSFSSSHTMPSINSNTFQSIIVSDIAIEMEMKKNFFLK